MDWSLKACAVAGWPRHEANDVGYGFGLSTIRFESVVLSDLSVVHCWRVSSILYKAVLGCTSYCYRGTTGFYTVYSDTVLVHVGDM